MALAIKSDKSVRSINENTLNIENFQTANQLAAKYKERVEADGGYVVDETYLQAVCEFLITNQLAGKVHTFCSARLGVRRFVSSAAPSSFLVDKLYNLIGDDLSYRLLEHPAGELPNATTVTDVTNLITNLSATSNNVSELITTDGNPYIKMIPQLVNRAISFYQKKPKAVSAGKSLGVALVFKSNTSITSSAFPLSFADISNSVSGGDSSDYTFRLILRSVANGSQSSLGVRVSNERTTATNNVYTQYINSTMLESPIDSDRVAIVHTDNSSKKTSISHKVSGVYQESSINNAEFLSNNFWENKPLNFSGEPSKELRRITGNLYDLVVFRDASFDNMKQLRDFLQSEL